jgi:hypothetical protein
MCSRCFTGVAHSTCLRLIQLLTWFAGCRSTILVFSAGYCHLGICSALFAQPSSIIASIVYYMPSFAQCALFWVCMVSGARRTKTASESSMHGTQGWHPLISSPREQIPRRGSSYSYSMQANRRDHKVLVLRLRWSWWPLLGHQPPPQWLFNIRRAVGKQLGAQGWLGTVLLKHGAHVLLKQSEGARPGIGIGIGHLESP